MVHRRITLGKLDSKLSLDKSLHRGQMQPTLLQIRKEKKKSKKIKTLNKGKRLSTEA
jgi:hypothetical protein